MSGRTLLTRKGVVVCALGTTQTLAWGSTYYLTAVFADPVSDGLHLSRTWFFGTFSAALLREQVRRFPETHWRARGRFGILVLPLKNKQAPQFYLT